MNALWIRSQDRKKLVCCNDIAISTKHYEIKAEDILNCNKNKNVYEVVGYFEKNTEYELLGTYSTKERALEVLDEIQNIFSLNYENKTYHEIDLLLKAKMLDSCYEMPKE